jgi:hypothetical protein
VQLGKDVHPERRGHNDSDFPINNLAMQHTAGQQMRRFLNDKINQ